VSPDVRLRALLVAAGIATLVVATPARAATIDVTTTSDGTGACPANLRQQCTLRQAVAVAGAGDTIRLPAGMYTLTQSAGGQINLNTNVAIVGASAATTTVQGDGKSFRVFSVGAEHVALLQHLTIQKGANTSTDDGIGGNVQVNSAATLLLDHARLTLGTALRGGGLGIRFGNVQISHSLIDNNTATGTPGEGGGIEFLGSPGGAGNTLQISDSTIFHNAASVASGIVARDNVNNRTTLTRSTVSLNSANSTPGAGVYVGDAESFTATGSIISGNTGDGVAANCNLKLTSGGGSIDSATTCGLDKPNTDAQLSTLLFSAGGETPVLTIPATSFAIDLAGACTGTDQRDLARPQGKGCDAGAYEFDFAPDTVIDTGPSGSIASAAPSYTFSSPEPGVHFECRLDGPGAATGTFGACTSPKAYTALADGGYTFSVFATDTVGHPDATAATRSFIVDTTGPDTTLTSGPSGPTNVSSPSFGFTSTRPGSTFECKLDGPGAVTGSYAACTTPKAYVDLADGVYTFSVRAKDSLNRLDPTAATRSLTIDTTPPPAEVISGPEGPTTDSAPAFGFSSADPQTTFACKLDGPGAAVGTFGPCASPASFGTLAPGDYTFAMQATDAAGNKTLKTRSFTVTLRQQATPTPTPSPTPTPGPTPVSGKSVVIAPVSGKTLIKKPGSTTFVPLDFTQGIPLGSIVDTRHSKIRLFAIPKPGRPVESALFYDGLFKVTQIGTVTQLQLVEALAACKATKASAAAKKPKTRKLWGDGSGSFRTRGQYSAATVRGTRWLVQDSCGKTLTKVAKGVVSVQDFVKKKTVLVRAPKRYTARQRY
jgi:hypothetical protein